jgi:hypothetical protein
MKNIGEKNNMSNSFQRLEEIKQGMTVSKGCTLADAYIQSEQSRYMNMGHDPGTAVKMAISHLDEILKGE